ncbi:bud emergence protein 1 [Mortierella sp. NVP85]|nr:bud emergence protein 1 [Mortierella sp. NVP85]
MVNHRDQQQRSGEDPDLQEQPQPQKKRQQQHQPKHQQQPHNPSASGDQASSSTSPVAHKPTTQGQGFQPLYGVVISNFFAWGSDELDARVGDSIDIVGQSNEGWFVARIIGQKKQLGVIPRDHVEVRDRTTGIAIDVEKMLQQTGTSIPYVEQQEQQQQQSQDLDQEWGQQEQHQQHQHQPIHRNAPPKPAFMPLYGVVLHDVVAQQPDDLDARRSDTILILDQPGKNWYLARHVGQSGEPGWIPVNYVELRDMVTKHPVTIQEEQQRQREREQQQEKQIQQLRQQWAESRPCCCCYNSRDWVFPTLFGVVRYDFNAEHSLERDYRVGETILILHQLEEWYVAQPAGRLGRTGYIPVRFVEVRDMATGKPMDLELIPVPTIASTSDVEVEQKKQEQQEKEKQKGEEARLREKAEKEKAEKEKAEKEKAEKEKAEKEKAEREKAEREKAEREKVEKEKVRLQEQRLQQLQQQLQQQQVQLQQQQQQLQTQQKQQHEQFQQQLQQLQQQRQRYLQRQPSTATEGFDPWIGTVLYSQRAWGTNELTIEPSDSVLILGKANETYYVAKHLGRSEDPGLVPISYVSMRERIVPKPINPQEMLQQRYVREQQGQEPPVTAWSLGQRTYIIPSPRNADNGNNGADKTCVMITFVSLTLVVCCVPGVPESLVSVVGAIASTK